MGSSTVGYGPLRARRAENDGVAYLALPTGFTYYAFGHVGSPMANGQPTPGAHDGMAAFPGPDGTVVLVRNHEQSNGTPFSPVAYDPGASGGTTNILFDPEDPANPVVTPSLSGTIRNCAGGPTPWGSWLTCEETTQTGPSQPHGYVFDVAAGPGATGSPVPFKAMGRFAHEAVAVDPATLAVYETEDAGSTSGFYLFDAASKANGRPDLTAGTLYMLGVAGDPEADLSAAQPLGATYDVEWVPVDAAAVDVPSGSFADARAKGGAAFRRLEGAWWSEQDGVIYFNSTDGGGAAAGQVWGYKPGGATPADGGTLTLIYESPAASTLLKPDNITITPRHGLLLCEDTDNARQTFLKGLTTDGQLFDFAANIREGNKPGTTTPARNDEFAGATFSPDGKWLFVNIQTPGVTFAIRGPWARGEL